MDQRIERFSTFLFDLDGVLTDTASVHARCWKEMFDEFLASRARRLDEAFVEFHLECDYHAYVDGKPRYDGVRDFLGSRGIRLPEGDPDDPEDLETVCGLGNRKNTRVNAVIEREGVAPYPGSVALLDALRSRGAHMAVVSSSQNCERVLVASGLHDYFGTIVDGTVAARLALPGKPAPDTFIEAARELGATPPESVVVEDALSGIEAGVAGGFGLVIGVARKGNRAALTGAGAGLVVGDLGELVG